MENKKVLIGTTNPSKINRFQQLLQGYNLSFYTLNDLNILSEPEETGRTPEENAIIKAKYYGQYFDLVICNDAGLYFDELDLLDSRQPGLNIRSPQGVRLDDEAIISYYAKLIHSLGGKVLAYYIDGIAVYNKGKVLSLMEDSEATKQNAFYMLDKAAVKRHPGWPLDSLSVNCKTSVYFVDEASNEAMIENTILDVYQRQVQSFLIAALKI